MSQMLDMPRTQVPGTQVLESQPVPARLRVPTWIVAVLICLLIAAACWLGRKAPRDAAGPNSDAPVGQVANLPTERVSDLPCPRAADCFADPIAVAPLRPLGGLPRVSDNVVLCQALGPAAPCPICAVDCSMCRHGRCRGWEQARLIAFQAYAQGEYVGHARLAHVPVYRIRVDDQLELSYRLTRDESPTPYRLNVGDVVKVELDATEKDKDRPDLDREVLIQPDGTITLPLLGQVHATGCTVTQLRDKLVELYKKYYKVQNTVITVTPLKVNTKLEDLRATVDRRYGIGGQAIQVRVTPEGTISLPAIGFVRCQGLSLEELRVELNERYREAVEGIEVIPVLTLRAPRFCYVVGAVRVPGRFEMVGPTTVLQAIAMAGSWNVGANLDQVVVFRRGDDWRLMATMVNLRGALRGKQPCPKGEIWLSDSDIVIVPQGPLLEADNFIELVFTRGIYGVFPMSTSINFQKLSSL